MPPDFPRWLLQVIFDGEFDTSTGPDTKKLSNLVLTGGGNVLLGSPRAVDLAILPGGPQSEKVSTAYHPKSHWFLHGIALRNAFADLNGICHRPCSTIPAQVCPARPGITSSNG